MKALPRKVLCDLLRDYGRELMTDSRLKGLLMDYCGSCRAEIHVLVQAQQAGIPERLWRDSQRLPVGVVVAQLSTYLQTDYFVAAVAAQWAVESWALALELELPAPAPPVTPVPEPPVEHQHPVASLQPLVVRAEHSVSNNPQSATRIPRLPFEPEMILIPAGEFLMGSDPRKDKDARDNEKPQHQLYLRDYYIAKTPVTNAQYVAFVGMAGYKAPLHWPNGNIPPGKDAHPVVNVSWNDAMTYCRWLAKATGKPYTLPSEAEWEKAARGPVMSEAERTDGRIYPWGNTFDDNKCNVKESGMGGTTPVDRYPQGTSPYGVLDMAGNVYEWTRSQWKSYLYDPEDGRENTEGGVRRVVRGGAFNYNEGNARCAFRTSWPPVFGYPNNGFRVAVSGWVPY